MFLFCCIENIQCILLLCIIIKTSFFCYFIDYSGQGFDQLMDCIKKIKTSPEDRRIIMSAWNPADLDQMVMKTICYDLYALDTY